MRALTDFEVECLYEEWKLRGEHIKRQDRLIERQREEIERLHQIAFGRYTPLKGNLTLVGGTDFDG